MESEHGRFLASRFHIQVIEFATEFVFVAPSNNVAQCILTLFRPRLLFHDDKMFLSCFRWKVIKVHNILFLAI